MRVNRGEYPKLLPAGLAAALLCGMALVAAPPAAAGPGDAPGGPGSLSHHDLARKDCLGTARNTASKIWYTVANGVLSDVYAPTVDATNVETMQYLVTDGSSFTDLQARDMTYTVSADTTGMACTVTATAKSGKYQLITSYLTDPARASVVAHTQYKPLAAGADTYQLYVRLDASAGGNGGGGTANGGGDTAVIDTSSGVSVPVSYDTNTTTNATGRGYAVPSYVALRGDQPFPVVSSGFVGTSSDGLAELDGSHALTPTYSTASNGNVEQTAKVQRDGSGSFTLALGFGATQVDAVNTAAATAATPVGTMTSQYQSAWQGYDAGLRAPSATLPGLTAAQRQAAVTSYYQSANVVKASEDKTFPGAIIAGLDVPWGQAVSAGDPNNLFTPGYREVFGRDLYEAWTALYTAGDLSTAQAATRYLLLKSQRPDGSQPRNSLLNGAPAPDAFNTQLDEAAYPLLMALQSGLASDNALWPHVQAGANFLISHGPSYGVERWEEQSGYSPSTISAEIAGLVAAAAIAQTRADAADARIWLATADQFQRSAKAWDVTSSGHLSASPYFIRIAKTGDPNVGIKYNLGNGGFDSDQRDVADLGFLEYVRLGELPATDATVQNSISVVDATLKKPTNSGAGWLRYNGDGYGDCYVPAGVSSCSITGAPWAYNFTGTGHPWPVLGAERAQQYLAQGQASSAAAVLAAINQMNSGPGLVPEQVWDGSDLAAAPYGSDPTTASIGFVNGKADGSASPLTWGAAAQVRLTADLTAGSIVERPSQTTDRYVTHPQASTPLTVTAPADQSIANATTTVAGTAAPGATIDVADVLTSNNDATTHTTGTVAASGSFSLTVRLATGTNMLVISSTAPTGGTAQTVRTVGLPQVCAAGSNCEAESGYLVGAVSVAHDHAGYTGTGFAAGFESTGAALGYLVSVPATGTYTLTMRYANHNGATSSLTAAVDADAARLALPDTGSWDTWSTVRQTYQLSAGTHLLVISRGAADSGQVNVDNLSLTAVTPPSCATGSTCEAESGLLSGDARVQNDHGGYTGTGFVGGFETVGAALSYQLSIPSSGRYAIKVRYANSTGGDGQTITRTLSLKLDGGAPATLTLPTTADWNTWAEVGQTVALSSGSHHLIIYRNAADSGNVNIDHLTAVAAP